MLDTESRFLRVRPVLVPSPLAGMLATLGQQDWWVANTAAHFANIFADVIANPMAEAMLDDFQLLLLSNGELVRITLDHGEPTYIAAWQLSAAQAFDFMRAMDGR